MKKTKLVFFTIIFSTIMLILAMQNNVFAAVEKEIDNVKIEIPEPVVGEKLTNAEKVSVKADGEEFEVINLEWTKYNEETGKYDVITDLENPLNAGLYSVLISYKRPNTYGYKTTTKITVNGNNIDMNNIAEFNEGSFGDLDFNNDVVTYRFRVFQKEISNVKVEIPEPIVGEKPADTTKVSVKADGEEFEIYEIKWLKYNNETQKYEYITGLDKAFEKNEKYTVMIGYKRPNTYGYKSTIKVTVNGNNINANNIAEFNCGSVGDQNFDYDYVAYEFKETTDKEQNAIDEKNQESTAKKEKDDTPKTGEDNYIFLTAVISIIALSGIILLNRKN